MASNINALTSSMISGARRAGLLPYLRYRYLSYRGVRNPIRVNVSNVEIQVRPSTPDLRVAFQSLGSELLPLAQLLPQSFDGLIVDAGGYIGTAAIKLATMYPNATVVSVEPSSSNFAILTQNTRPYPNIKCINAALFTTAGRRISLADRGTGDWGFTVAMQADQTSRGAMEEVETVTFGSIKALFPNKEIGLVKLDIEGGEHAIFLNDDPDLRAAPAVFTELHDRIVPGCSAAFHAFFRDCWIVDVGGEKLLALRKSC
ncbi:MAG: FkbM family methyltransferase [Acidobacteria bacterium]|nr:FkbM family methyltransferase [Acidobacteriota bacterium]